MMKPNETQQTSSLHPIGQVQGVGVWAIRSVHTFISSTTQQFAMKSLETLK